MDAPGHCSPSRNVVSKMITLSDIKTFSWWWMVKIEKRPEPPPPGAAAAELRQNAPRAASPYESENPWSSVSRLVSK